MSLSINQAKWLLDTWQPYFIQDRSALFASTSFFIILEKKDIFETPLKNYWKSCDALRFGISLKETVSDWTNFFPDEICLIVLGMPFLLFTVFVACMSVASASFSFFPFCFSVKEECHRWERRMEVGQKQRQLTINRSRFRVSKVLSVAFLGLASNIISLFHGLESVTEMECVRIQTKNQREEDRRKKIKKESAQSSAERKGEPSGAEGGVL